MDDSDSKAGDKSVDVFGDFLREEVVNGDPFIDPAIFAETVYVILQAESDGDSFPRIFNDLDELFFGLEKGFSGIVCFREHVEAKKFAQKHCINGKNVFHAVEFEFGSVVSLRGESRIGLEVLCGSSQQFNSPLVVVSKEYDGVPFSVDRTIELTVEVDSFMRTSQMYVFLQKLKVDQDHLVRATAREYEHKVYVIVGQDFEQSCAESELSFAMANRNVGDLILPDGVLIFESEYDAELYVDDNQQFAYVEVQLASACIAFMADPNLKEFEFFVGDTSFLLDRSIAQRITNDLHAQETLGAIFIEGHETIFYGDDCSFNSFIKAQIDQLLESYDWLDEHDIFGGICDGEFFNFIQLGLLDDIDDELDGLMVQLRTDVDILLNTYNQNKNVRIVGVGVPRILEVELRDLDFEAEPIVSIERPDFYGDGNGYFPDF